MYQIQTLQLSRVCLFKIKMAITSFFRFVCLSLFTFLSAQSKHLPYLTSPYLSPTTIFPNYQKMLQSFKIFIYKPNKPFTYETAAESLFYTSLLHSPFRTENPDEAHLFFVPFSPDLSMRSLARFIRTLRMEQPYWNRTLGADHFYLSCTGIGYESDRNLVELKKNSVQISCFPTRNGNFVPHKDITLPPVKNPQAPLNTTARFLGYVMVNGGRESTLVNELSYDPEFLIESQPSDQVGRSKFCLFDYEVDVTGIGEALSLGCVPAVITDRPINDLPFMDVLRWQEMVVVVKRERGVKEVKRVLDRTWRERYEEMRGLGVVASKHFEWHEQSQPFDSFQTVMYELWLRRHTIRYVRREAWFK
ncbi:Exostosin-like [Quillaja saponaria]|uniref:Exostosin-like n=1 Tax=Quillaja saponaria TaxID=32244 RepID=A0AAD7LUL0_QUISA|nr:Exostosin-like [Quillaja saponaria]